MESTILFDVPNEQVVWTIGIAFYIFLSGMSAGSFLLSTLHTVFGIERYKPFAQLGVVNALIVLAIAPVFLILDLSQPTRAYYAMLYQNPSSVMTFGVILLNLYGLNCAIYAWFLFRRNLYPEAQKIEHLAVRGLLLSLLSLLGLDDSSPRILERDARHTRLFGAIGVVLAICLAGYTGFILAVVSANHLWHSALVPILFSVSAIVSGMALMVLVYTVRERYFSPRKRVDPVLLGHLGRLMAWFLLLDLGLMFAELIILRTSGGEGAEILWLFFDGPFRFPFLGLELFLGGLIPIVLIFHTRTGRTVIGPVTAAFLTLVGIAAMRYNIVIGGQALPKSGNELVVYHIATWEIAVVFATFVMLGTLLVLALKILPFDRGLVASQVSTEEDSGGGPGLGNDGDGKPTRAVMTTSEGQNTARIDGVDPLSTASASVKDNPGTTLVPLEADLSRRDFIRTCGAAMVFLSVGSVGPNGLASIVVRDPDSLLSSKKRYAMVIDLRKCVGCHSCTQACKAEFELPQGVWRSWVKKLRKTSDDGSVKDFFLPRLCNHCDKPPCVSVCPVQATYKNRDGVTLQRADRCIGCKYCIQACPYTARYVHPETKVVDKCTFCYDNRVRKGRLPACVEACPGGARIFGDLHNSGSEVAKLVASLPMQTLKPEQGTRPMVFYHQADEQIMQGGLH